MPATTDQSKQTIRLDYQPSSKATHSPFKTDSRSSVFEAAAPSALEEHTSRGDVRISFSVVQDCHTVQVRKGDDVMSMVLGAQTDRFVLARAGRAETSYICVRPFKPTDKATSVQTSVQEAAEMQAAVETTVLTAEEVMSKVTLNLMGEFGKLEVPISKDDFEDIKAAIASLAAFPTTKGDLSLRSGSFYWLRDVLTACESIRQTRSAQVVSATDDMKGSAGEETTVDAATTSKPTGSNAIRVNEVFRGRIENFMARIESDSFKQWNPREGDYGHYVRAVASELRPLLGKATSRQEMTRDSVLSRAGLHLATANGDTKVDHRISKFMDWLAPRLRDWTKDRTKAILLLIAYEVAGGGIAVKRAEQEQRKAASGK